MTGTCKSLVIFHSHFNMGLFSDKISIWRPPPVQVFLVSVCDENKPVRENPLRGSRVALPCERPFDFEIVCLTPLALACFAVICSEACSADDSIPSVGMPANGDSPVSAKPNESLHSISPFDSLIGHVADISYFSR